MAVKWKWKPAAGGSVSPELQNKVNQNETKINTIEQKYVKKDEANTFTAANTFNAGNNLLTYTSTNTTKPDNEVLTRKDLTYVRKVRTNFNIPANGYEIISVMVGRKRNSDGYYFFQYHTNLNFQVFLHTDGTYKIYTQGPISDFGPEFRIIVVEKKI